METSTETPTGPFHVLMATTATAAATTSPSNQRILLFDPRLQHDYVAKRKKAYGTETNTNNGNNNDDDNIWDGVSKVERELVCCCEKPEETDNGGDAHGALDIEKEMRFAGILARDCHTMATRFLALAILERTLDISLLEVEEEDDSENEDGEEAKEEEEMEGVASDDERDDDAWKPGKKRRSPRQRENQQKRKRQKTSKEKKEGKREDEEVGRLEQFLAAGGLKILNQWLIEAANEDYPPPLLKPPPPGTSIKKQQPTGPKPPAGRPLILPILRFLERIPFDKKLVMDSKINKQIRKLGKQVDGILEARARGKHRSEDLENWTTEPTSAETDALDLVQDAIDTVKSSWEQMAKKQNDKFTDPFESLKEKMRERLDILTQFETGAIPKPDWLETQEPIKDAKKKAARPNTQELAAKERRAERDDLKNALRAAADEHRERMAQLRETLRKRKEENAPTIRHKKAGGKKVVWKDDMRTQINRNRKLLEEVFLFEKKLPASRRGVDENVEDFEAEESTSSSSDEAARGDALTFSDYAVDPSLL